jgi:type VI secretion system protein ImpJ
MVASECGGKADTLKRMKSLQPVIWSKGTFLTPQHLQMQDRFIESSLLFRLEALNFRPWGFQRLQLDYAKLAAGTFAITSATGILPDGLLFDMPNADPVPPSKPLADAFEPDEDTVDIYMAIPVHRERGINVAVNQIESNARYSVQTVALRDENSGLSERPIQVARKNVRFLLKGEIREGTTALCAGRIKRTKAGMYQADSSFVPPLIDYTASEYLVSIVRRLVEILSAKSSQLAGARRQKNVTLASFTASDIPNFWLLYTINSYFPWLNHLYESKTGHPESVFLAMLALAGALTTFSTDLQPRDFPLYDHDNLTYCFADLDEKLRLLLDTVIPSNYVALPLKLVQPSIYAVSIADEKYFNKTRMYLAINADVNQADLISKTPHLVKVGSAGHVEHLVRQALIGLTLTHVPSPPSSIPVKLNYQYFSLNQAGVAWEAIGRERNLAAYVPGDLPNPQLELIILFT